MTWPILWPAAANIDSADQLLRSYAEQYAVDTLRLLTVGRVGGNPITVLPGATALNRADAILLEAPVGRIDSVTVLGLPLDPSAYVVENGNLLVRTDGGGWPTAGLAVTYQNSYPADTLAQHVAGVLALEYLRLMTTGKCRLPAGVTNIARQGVTMEIETGMFPNGLTQVPEVDVWIKRWNPNALKSKPRVITPDLPEHRRVTWSAP